MGRLFLREQADIDALLSIIAENNLVIGREAVEHACKMLSDDWLTLSYAGGPNCICQLSFGKNKGGLSGLGYALHQWTELVASLYELRCIDGVEEQVRRLCILSHERLDTALVVVVAARYKGRGWEVDFEPNGKGCSNLRVAKANQIFYVEVKRENTQDHVRFNALRANSNAILNALPSDLTEWLEKTECRIEANFSRGISASLVQKICDELKFDVLQAPIGIEQPLTVQQGSQFIVLHKDSEQHFKNGFISTIVRIKQPGVAVQLNDPKNMPVQIIFEWQPNVMAIRELLRKAKRQLQNDAKVNPNAVGFIVIQARGGEDMARAIEERYLRNFPTCCLGVAILSDFSIGDGQIVCRDELDEKILEAMSHAANVDRLSPNPVNQASPWYLSVIVMTPP